MGAFRIARKRCLGWCELSARRHACHPGMTNYLLALILALVLALWSLHTSAQDPRRSSFDAMSPATQALQRDDSRNPAMLWVKEGEALWSRAPASGTKSCTDCHGGLSRMRGVATRYPAFDANISRVLNLGERVNLCRTTHQGQAPWRTEESARLSVEAAIALQSRGLPITPPAHPALKAAQQRGATLFASRIGQVDLSCADCHTTLAGKRLGGAKLPQAHPTGYPIYRLEWQSLGSLNRRLRSCLSAVRADASSFSDEEFVAIEAYLMQRANGMPLETPGVRP